MGANEDKTKFSIRVDTQLLELADSCIGNGAARNRTELIRQIVRDFPSAKEMLEYMDFLLRPTMGNASEFISCAICSGACRCGRIRGRLWVILRKSMLCNCLTWRRWCICA